MLSICQAKKAFVKSWCGITTSLPNVETVSENLRMYLLFVQNSTESYKTSADETDAMCGANVHEKLPPFREIQNFNFLRN